MISDAVGTTANSRAIIARGQAQWPISTSSPSSSRTMVLSSRPSSPDCAISRRNISQLKLPFPWKLHQLLDDAAACSTCFQNEYLRDIVSWLPGGHAFRIHKPEIFAAKIMPNYFRQTKFTSFIRQLYMYGFTKIEDGEYRGGYYHPEFTQENKSASMSLARERHNDRRLKEHFPDKEYITCFLAERKKAGARSSLGAGSHIEPRQTKKNGAAIATRTGTSHPLTKPSIQPPAGGAIRGDVPINLLLQDSVKPASNLFPTDGAPLSYDLPSSFYPMELCMGIHPHRSPDSFNTPPQSVQQDEFSGEIPHEWQLPNSATNRRNPAQTHPASMWNDVSHASWPQEQTRACAVPLSYEPRSIEEMSRDPKWRQQQASVRPNEEDERSVCRSGKHQTPWGRSFDNWSPQR